MRQLPDGTWLNETTGTVSAPLQDQWGGADPKRAPSPPMGPITAPIQAEAPAPEAQMIAGIQQPTAARAGQLPGMGSVQQPTAARAGQLPGMGAYVNTTSYSPNGMTPGMGQGILDNMSLNAKRMILLGAVVGVASLTVWLNNRGKSKSKK